MSFGEFTGSSSEQAEADSAMSLAQSLPAAQDQAVEEAPSPGKASLLQGATQN